MSKINVLGTGIVGSAAAFDLIRRGHDVSVADGDPEAASRAGDELGVAHSTIDAGDGAAVASFLDGCDAMVSAVPYGYGTIVAEEAIEAGCHYVDFGGNPSVVARQLLLDEKARAAGIAVVPDCGLAALHRASPTSSRSPLSINLGKARSISSVCEWEASRSTRKGPSSTNSPSTPVG